MCAQVTKQTYRQGTSYARSASIDGFLSDSLCAELYQKWNPAWGQPLIFQGGVTGITAELVLKAPEKELIKAFGKMKAAELLQAARMAGRGE